jgi:hypothetical protein
VLGDIAASLVEVRSENDEGAEPSFTGGFGFRPMFCFAEATGETFARLCTRATPRRRPSPIA